MIASLGFGSGGGSSGSSGSSSSGSSSCGSSSCGSSSCGSSSCGSSSCGSSSSGSSGSDVVLDGLTLLDVLEGVILVGSWSADAFGLVDVTKPEDGAGTSAVPFSAESSIVYDGRGHMVEGSWQAEVLDELEVGLGELSDLVFDGSVSLPFPLVISMV